MAADVSIIVPVYNMEHFLTETLDSIEAAIAPSLAVEVIVMDDGSTDGSFALAQDYAARHERIRVFTQPNAGPSVARNRAIAEATGRYIFPLDSDDLLGRDFLEQAVRILDERPKVKV
ncbi:MAG: glycosyltransferase family 2 protein, partial [Alistipes sp.]|nr:glycosyltransferase family 2 protein [Alistipes sp.]